MTSAGNTASAPRSQAGANAPDPRRPQRSFPFFLGRGRSGTTMVRAMFDAHPEFTIPDESHFVVALGTRRQRYEQPDGFDTRRLLDDLDRRVLFHACGLARPELADELVAAQPADYASAVRCVFAGYARQQGKSRYGDKTPNYVLNIDLLAELFAEARFVHIIRDGRDVALSYLQAPWRPTVLEEAAVLWRRWVSRGREQGQRLGPDRYLEVRYESLVEAPEDALRTICAFIDLKYDPAMLEYHRGASRLLSQMNQTSANAHTGLRRPPTKDVRNWRREMSRHDTLLFEALAGDLLSELGYERAATSLPPTIRLEAGARRLRVEGRRVVRHFRRYTPPGTDDGAAAEDDEVSD